MKEIAPLRIKFFQLTLILLNNLISHTHFWLSANQITSYIVFVQIHKLNDKQWRSWSEAIWSGSTLFAKVGVVVNSRIRVKVLVFGTRTICQGSKLLGTVLLEKRKRSSWHSISRVKGLNRALYIIYHNYSHTKYFFLLSLVHLTSLW